MVGRLLDRLGPPSSEEDSITIALEAGLIFSGAPPFQTVTLALLEAEARRAEASMLAVDLNVVIEHTRQILRGRPPLSNPVWDAGFGAFYSGLVRSWLRWRATRAPP